MTWQPSSLTTAQREERRLEAARLLRTTPLSKAEAARRVGVSRTAVTQWARQMRQRRRGPDSLRARRRTGRPPRLTAADWRRVLTLLRRGARAAGYETDRWTLPRIRRLIHEEFSATYSTGYPADKLHALGWTPQRPAPRARERDEELIAAWLCEHWPRIKKGPAHWRGHRLC